MAGERVALVVAVDTYDSPELRRLAAPAADAEALADVLGDPDLGGFRVEIVHNAPSGTVCERVDEILSDRKSSDVVLLHFSCHGIKDDSGELYLAATNTIPGRLVSTGVEAALVSRLMRRSRAGRIILLLDCCYGGAFERGVIARAAGDVDVGGQFAGLDVGGGRGRVVITASAAMEYAFEGPRLAEGGRTGPSVFTGALVKGIRTGGADKDNDGFVSLGEMYDYLYDEVRSRSPNQTPSKWEFGTQGELRIARNPHRRVVPGQLPRELLDLLVHPIATVRIGAVHELENLAAGANLPLAAAARQAVAELENDDSRRVSQAAAEALGRTRLRLSPPALDLGEATVGGDPAEADVRLDGPPLALAAAVSASAGPLQARLDGAVLRLRWAPEDAGVLAATVRVVSPVGDVTLDVAGRAAPAEPVPRVEPVPSAEPVPDTEPVPDPEPASDAEGDPAAPPASGAEAVPATTATEPAPELADPPQQAPRPPTPRQDPPRTPSGPGVKRHTLSAVHKRVLAVVAAAVVVLVGVWLLVPRGDGSGGSTPSAPAGSPSSAPVGPTYTMSMISSGSPDDDKLRAGAGDAAREKGIELTSSAGRDGPEMATLVQNAIDAKAHGIIVDLAYADAIEPTAKKAAAVGIPVVAVAHGFDQYQPAGAQAFFGVSDAQAGQEVGERISAAGGGTVVCVITEQGSVALEERCAGLQKAHSNIEILQVNGTDLVSVAQTINSKLQQDPSISHVVTLDTATAMAAVAGKQSAGNDAAVVTMGLTTDVGNAIQAGEIEFSLDFVPYQQGYQAVSALWDRVANKSSGWAAFTGPSIVDKSNIAQVLPDIAAGRR